MTRVGGGKPPRALTIAGSDSGGGAGIQADLKTFAAMGVYGTAAITAVTAQNTRGVACARAVEPELVAAQVRAVLEDIGCDAGKVGVLGNGGVVEAVGEALARFAPFPLVVDPVFRSSSGTQLFADEDVDRFKDVLLPRTTLLTPNLEELARLVGRRREDVQTFAGRIEAVEALLEAGASAVLVKGGHSFDEEGTGTGSLEPASERRVVDLLHDGLRVHRLEHAWIDTPHTHGTGCVLSAAIAAALALGLPLPRAVERGRQHLLAALRLAVAVGEGTSPVNHTHARWTH